MARTSFERAKAYLERAGDYASSTNLPPGDRAVLTALLGVGHAILATREPCHGDACESCLETGFEQ